MPAICKAETKHKTTGRSQTWDAFTSTTQGPPLSPGLGVHTPSWSQDSCWAGRQARPLPPRPPKAATLTRSPTCTRAAWLGRASERAGTLQDRQLSVKGPALGSKSPEPAPGKTLTSTRVKVGGSVQDDEMQEQGRGVHLHGPRQEPAEKLHVPAKGSQLRLSTGRPHGSRAQEGLQGNEETHPLFQEIRARTHPEGSQQGGLAAPQALALALQSPGEPTTPPRSTGPPTLTQMQNQGRPLRGSPSVSTEPRAGRARSGAVRSMGKRAAIPSMLSEPALTSEGVRVPQSLSPIHPAFWSHGETQQNTGWSAHSHPQEAVRGHISCERRPHNKTGPRSCLPWALLPRGPSCL